MKTEIKDKESGNSATVTEFGQLVTAPVSYSQPVEVLLDATATAFNFIEPRSGTSIVITDILTYAARTVSPTTPADIQVYQSDEVDSSTVLGGIVSPQLTSGGQSELTGLNLLIPEGRWVNAITDDADVKITIMFYRVSADT